MILDQKNKGVNGVVSMAAASGQQWHAKAYHPETEQVDEISGGLNYTLYIFGILHWFPLALYDDGFLFSLITVHFGEFRYVSFAEDNGFVFFASLWTLSSYSSPVIGWLAGVTGLR